MKKMLLLTLLFPIMLVVSCDGSDATKYIVGSWTTTDNSWLNFSSNPDERIYYENGEETYTFYKDGSFTLSYSDPKLEDEKSIYEIRENGTLILYGHEYNITKKTKRLMILDLEERNSTKVYNPLSHRYEFIKSYEEEHLELKRK